MKELPVPDAVTHDENASELLRVIETDENQHYIIEPHEGDPGDWGILLADIAKQAAYTYEDKENWSTEKAFTRIIQQFAEQLENNVE